MRLSALRTLKGVTQQEVADHLGISQQRYQNYEKGKNEPKVAYWLALADYYGTSVDAIMRGNNGELTRKGIRAA